MKGAGSGSRRGAGCLLLWISVLVWMGEVGSAAGQRGPGYQVSNDRIVVETPSQWRNWTLPTHAVEVTPDGRVVPHMFRARYNLLDDRDSFQRALKEFKRGRTQSAILNLDSTETLDIRGNLLTQKVGGKVVPVYTYLVQMGISRVGSNADQASAILDGDRTTYWEPDPSSSLDDWWIEVDLGRVAVVDSVVLHFVDEALGDPFRQFRLLVAPDQRPVVEEALKVDFEMVARTTAPNRDVREFSFGVEQPRASPEWTGRMVETLRIVVTDSKRGQGHQISEAEWQELPESDRGEIVHFIRDDEGFEEPVEPSVYEELSADRRGRKEYYRRERPRLADIEVWGYGDNISLGMVEGGGNLALTGDGFSPVGAFDGDFVTQFPHVVREKTAIVDRGVLTIDMGATFWLDAVRTSSPFSWPIIEGYIMRGSDGTLDTNGQLKWNRLTPLKREDNSLDRFQHLLEKFASLNRIRFLEIITVDQSQGIYVSGPKIAEYQLFSEGYPSEVLLHSDLIELPTGRSLGRIFWEGDTPADTELEIRTRTGSLRRKVVRHFDKSGSEITGKQWGNLMGSFKGPVDTAFVAGSDWSIWSRSYLQPGEVVRSPSQNAFLQLQVSLRTNDRFQAASIGGIDIELLNPVAERMVAELWPIKVDLPGRIDTFEVFAQPFFVERPVSVRSTGFDELLVNLPGVRELRLLELAVGIDPESGQATQQFDRLEDGRFVDAAGESLQLLQSESDSLWVRFPSVVHALPAEQAQPIYYRLTAEQEQVPVDRKGQLLSEAAYGQLPPEERGDRRYYRRQEDELGQVRLTQVAEEEFDGLLEADRQVRYFRILLDEGGQFAFDVSGDSLDVNAYNALSSADRGRIVGKGPLLRLRVAAPVYVNGATVSLAVRNTMEGSDLLAPWQGIEAGDATGLADGNALSIQVPLNVKPLGDFVVSPNPFTPNGDGINDEMQISFSVFKVGRDRQVRVGMYRLDGGRVWERRLQVRSGQVDVVWPGTDALGKRVPPGIYLCQVNLEVDSEDIGPTTRTRLIHVVY